LISPYVEPLIIAAKILLAITEENNFKGIFKKLLTEFICAESDAKNDIQETEI
jgi:hypothetical protein